MKMSKRAEKALRGSIKKWEGILAGKTRDKQSDNCPLCQTFYLCEGCPVMEKTGYNQCRLTPYDEWNYKGGMGSTANTPKLKRIARKEIAFLKSLLPVRKK